MKSELPTHGNGYRTPGVGDMPLYADPEREAARRRTWGLALRRGYVGNVTDHGYSETLTVRHDGTEVSLTRDWRGRTTDVVGNGYRASRNAHQAVLEALNAPIMPADNAGIEAFSRAVAQMVLPAAIRGAIEQAVRAAVTEALPGADDHYRELRP